MGQYVFERGSNVLEYWLAHAEGFVVRARGSRVGVVRGVVVDPARGRATALVLRTRLHRKRVVLANRIEAVDPEAEVLELEVEERPSVVAILSHRFVRAASWLGPRAWAAVVAVDRRFDRAGAWLRPRLAAAALGALRFVRRYAGDAYQSCRTGRVREAARRTRRGAERAARGGGARAARGLRRLSHRSVHGIRRGSLRIRAYRARP